MRQDQRNVGEYPPDASVARGAREDVSLKTRDMSVRGCSDVAAC